MHMRQVGRDAIFPILFHVKFLTLISFANTNFIIQILVYLKPLILYLQCSHFFLIRLSTMFSFKNFNPTLTIIISNYLIINVWLIGVRLNAVKISCADTTQINLSGRILFNSNGFVLLFACL